MLGCGGGGLWSCEVVELFICGVGDPLNCIFVELCICIVVLSCEVV